MTEHPVQLIVEDDLRRNRLTVFLRLILAIPHLIWVLLWSIAVFFAAIANWLVTLIAGRPAGSLHRFLSAYVRYVAHLNAYLWLVANPYPGFVGEEGEYPVDVRLPPPEAQARWKTLLRIFLALPAIVLSSALGGGGAGSFQFSSGGGRNRSYGASGGGALALATSILGWFASVVRGQMPKGLRDAGAYSVGYGAQMLAYVLLVTDRYPNADPTAMLTGVERPPQHPVHLVGDAHDLRRSRVTVFFRLLLALPHLIWLTLWTIAAILAAILNWFVTLFTGTPAAAFHQFLSRYVRYELHVYAFLYLAANPFPGFTGEAGSYPLDLQLPERARQNRWKTGFRLILVIPALIVNGALNWLLVISAFYTWFVALIRGSAPWGLRNVSAYALRYSAQLNAYGYLLTDAYPHASPLEGAPPEQLTFDEEA
ncbi:MAG: DUF4389 domain-containing protein [Actinomycetota bacterium]|nr:DUF4389 domain-containing protein [Actinomycetota bacterium]